MDKGYARRA